jgi:ArsR family transcriptional regulator
MATLEATLDLMHVFGDATRVRLMALLAREELTVAELTAITELPQSRVSTHLARLREAGLLRDRRAGASTFYAMNDALMPETARRVWQLVSAEVSGGLLEADLRRAESLKRAKNGASWPDSIAGEMERHYSPGRTWEATARGLLGFLRLGDVLDIGSGDGVMAQLFAPRARSVTLIDRSSKMIDAARRRLSGQRNVQFQVGDMHELPFVDECFDEVLSFNVLTYAEHPERALGEAARVLRPRGTLSVVTLAVHEHADVTSAYGHVNAGFSPRELRRLLREAGLEVLSAGVTSREKLKPYFEVVTAQAEKVHPENGHQKRRKR